MQGGSYMKELVRGNSRLMTVKEIAEVLGKSIRTIQVCAKELFPNRIENGKIAYFNEAEVTLIKSNLAKNCEVAKQPKTDIEQWQQVEEVMIFLRNKIAELAAENARLEFENSDLKGEVVVADKYANYAITFLNDEYRDKFNRVSERWLPYKD
jgi:cell division protein FtsB